MIVFVRKRGCNKGHFWHVCLTCGIGGKLVRPGCFLFLFLMEWFREDANDFYAWVCCDVMFRHQLIDIKIDFKGSKYKIKFLQRK